MTIHLYRNTSDANVLDKNLTLIKSLNGALREGTSIINPIFTVECGTEIVGCNYIHVPAFNRYYFVGDIASIVNDAWNIAAHVDVLMSYRNQIRSLDAVVARQENEYNLYLDDDRFLTTCKRIYWTKAFPNRVDPASAGGSSFVFTAAGGAKTSKE